MNDDTPAIDVAKIKKVAPFAEAKVLKKELSNTVPLSGTSNLGSRSRPLNLLYLSEPVRKFINGPANIAPFSRRNNHNHRGDRKE